MWFYIIFRCSELKNVTITRVSVLITIYLREREVIMRLLTLLALSMRLMMMGALLQF